MEEEKNYEGDSMKFIHLADLHIGKIVKDFHMIEDQRYVLDQVIQTVKEEKIDAVLISGDVYDRTIPSEEAVRLFDAFLYELTQIPCKLLLISGNHDSDERLNFGSRLFEEKEVYFSTKVQETIKKISFQDEYGPIHFYLLPFVKASQVKHFYPEEEINNYEDAIRVLFAKTEMKKEERNVILAHQFVAGKSGSVEYGGSESLAVAKVGLVEKISYDCFDDFDYVALGHIHKAQAMGRPEVRYAGTPLKYHMDEAMDEKTMSIITMKEKGKVEIELRPWKPLRDMRCLKGPIKELLSEEHVKNPEDYIFATLTDEEIIPDAMQVFRQVYPNTMQIRYENSHTRELEHWTPEKVQERREFPELIQDFYQKMYQTEMTEEELELMKKVARKVGILHEA